MFRLGLCWHPRCLVFRLWICGILLLGGGGGCNVPVPPATSVQASRDEEAFESLIVAIHERLHHMAEVAQWKWTHRQPIDDPDREAEMLQRIAQRACEKNLDVAWVQAVFRDQIAASKQVQREWFERFRQNAEGPYVYATTLERMRQQIDASNERLLSALAQLGPLDAQQRSRLRQRITEHLLRVGYSAEVCQLAVAFLNE